MFLFSARKVSTFSSMCNVKSISLQVYKQYFSNNVNGLNLAPLVEQYIWRSDIALTRSAFPAAAATTSTITFTTDTTTLHRDCSTFASSTNYTTNITTVSTSTITTAFINSLNSSTTCTANSIPPPAQGPHREEHPDTPSAQHGRNILSFY